MRSRRPALILLVVVILLTGALSAAERDRRETASPATTTGGAPPEPAAGEPSAQVTAELPSSKPVRARTGDTVVLRIAGDTPDIAKIVAVGARAPVGPGLPGELRFVAPGAGDLPVTLELAGTTAGLVRVSDARD